MDNVTPLKPKKKLIRKSVAVCWGGFQMKEITQHIAIGPKGCVIDYEAGVLVIDEGEETLTSYPMGGVFYWTEKDMPDA